MRTLMITFAAAALAAGAAGASEIDNHAKTVFFGGATLKKAEANCGASARLSRRDQLALTYARAAAEQRLPLSEVQKMSVAAETEAVSASGATGFCAETKKKKPAMIGQIRKAGKALAAARAAG